MNFKVNGIREKLKPSKEGHLTPSLSSKVSPKEEWENKLKSYRLKFFLIFLISHLMWLSLYLGDSETSEKPLPRVPLEAGHTIVQLPAWNYGDIPLDGQKIQVSLVDHQNTLILSAYLRQLKEDPLGPTGQKAILEVKQGSLLKIKNKLGAWSIYPPLKITQHSQQTRSPYELSW